MQKESVVMQHEVDSGFSVEMLPPSIPPNSEYPESIMEKSSDDSNKTPGGCTASTNRSSLVKRHDYRDKNLRDNHIFIVQRLYIRECLTKPLTYHDEDPPVEARKLLEWIDVQPKEIPSEINHQYEKALGRMQQNGAAESDVAAWFRDAVFPKDPVQDLLRVQYDITFHREVVPSRNTPNRVAAPIPDIAIGYRVEGGAFTEGQRLAGQQISPTLGQANGLNLHFPFLTVEFKAHVHVNGDLWWEATNQCAGASASCVEIIDRLNAELRKRSEYADSGCTNSIATVAFSYSIDQSNAHLYITWKTEDCKYYMRRAKFYCLDKKEEFAMFRRDMRMIIEWGEHHRFKEIQAALDFTLDADRKKNMESVKKREPPSEKRVDR
ncbi:hypothetical protein F5Y16DRAFT_403589 [Xylariaceae sp. FL0255]|nr:hypothetical protein F5Y16DRAFT_403589 [Xylariaceae sp. FL0255]